MAYDKTIERIDNQQPGFQQLAKRTLSWIVYATRQLSVSELRHALAVENEAIELDEENLEETDEIINACAGLVTIEEDTNIIRLVHYTTQEYLERKLLTWEPLAEEMITRSCLTYLSFEHFTLKKLSFPKIYSLTDLSEYEATFNKVHFLEYAVDTWHSHAKHCWTNVVEQLVLCFLEGFPRLLYYGALRYIQASYEDGRVLSKRTGMAGFKTMHFAALFGLDRIVTALMQAGYNTRVVDGDNRTPLTYAAEFGHQAVVKLLLRDEKIWDIDESTPLHFAAKKGHKNIVKLLLNCEGIDVNAPNLDLDTPLNVAIEMRHEGVAKLLLERNEIDVNYDPSGNGGTALMSCAIVGNISILQQLLERKDVKLNSRNYQGSTALMLAVEFGNTEVFKQLLGTPGVEVHLKYCHNRTLLMLAAGSYLDSEDIVELLLDREDVAVNCQDNFGRTALMLATMYENNIILKRLLAREEIDVNSRDHEGQTALMMAASRENYEAVNWFLEREDLDVNCRDHEGQTTLMIYAQKRECGVVEKILEKKELDVNRQDFKGRTALMFAASDCYEDDDDGNSARLIGKLLERSDIDVNCRDENGQTALALAASCENYSFMKMLLSRDDIDRRL